MLKGLTNNKIAVWGFVFTLSNGLSKLFQLLLIIYLSAILNEYDFGLFSLLLTYQYGVMTFGSAGINENLISQIPTGKKTFSLINANNNATSFFLTIVSAFSFLLFYFFLRDNADYSLIFFPVFIGFIMSYSLYTTSAFKLEGDFSKALFFGPFVLIVLSISMIIISIITKKIFDIFLVGFISTTIFIILIILSFKVSLKFDNLFSIKENLRYIYPFTVIAIFAYLSGYGFNLISISILDVETIGIYSFLLTISTAPQIFASSLISIYSPKFYDLYINNNKSKALKSSNSFYILIIVMSFILSLIIIFSLYYSKNFDFPLNKYSEYYFKSSLILTGYLLAIPFWYNSMIIYIEKMNSEYMNSIVISGIIGILIWVILTAFFNELGLYIGFVLQVFFKSLILEFYIPKKSKNRSIWFYTVLSALFLNIITYLF